MGVDSPVPLMHHDPDRSWITDPNSDHPKGTHPMSFFKPNEREISNFKIISSVHFCILSVRHELGLAHERVRRMNQTCRT